MKMRRCVTAWMLLTLMVASAVEAGTYSRMMVDVSTLPPDKTFVADIIAARVRDRIGDVRSGPSLSVSLALDAALDGEACRVSVKDGRAAIRAGRFRGLLYGAGVLLRSATWRPSSFDLSDFSRTLTPAKPIRCAYYARHFYNWYHMASAEELIRLTEDLALWGVNALTFQFGYPVADLKCAQGDDVARFERVSRQLAEALERMDLEMFVSGGGNRAPHSTDPKLKAVPNTDPKRGNFGFNVCPAKPGGLELLVDQQKRYLDKYEGFRIGQFGHWPFDEGGCECETCRPWGGNGYLKLCKVLAAGNKARHPEARTCLSTWTFHDDEFERLWNYLATDESKWIDQLLVDSHGDFPQYPLTHKLPREIPIITFPEISMWGREPWGGFGAIAMPARFERLFRQAEKVASGFKFYSEGLSEDINKIVVTQLYVDPTRHWQDIVREYCRWEFPGMDPERFVELVTHLENTQALPNFQKKTTGTQEVGRGSDPACSDFEARCAYCLSEATKAERLSAELETSLTPACRTSWRWRHLRLRTIIDREIFAARKLNTPVADEAYRELERLYYAERTYSWVRPPVARGQPPADGVRRAGPNVRDLPNEPTAWRNCGPGGGGWLICVVESRHEKDRLLIGCDVGGFYFSADGGRTYEIRNNGLGSGLHVQRIVEHPRDPNVLYLGSRNGIYKSDDLGRHWRRLTNGFPDEDGYGHASPVEFIVVSEKDPNRVWAAVSARGSNNKYNFNRTRFGSIYRSDDGGESWRQLVSDDAEIVKGRMQFAGFLVDPRDENQMLVSTTNGIYHSEDGGVRWMRSSEGFPPYPARRLARSPSSPSVIYAGFRENRGKWDGRPRRAGFCRSDDNGRTWRELGAIPESFRREAGRHDYRYTEDGGIAVDPSDPDVLWASGGSFLASGVFRSTDGGRSWTETFLKGYRPNAEAGDWCPWGRGVGSMCLSPRNPKCFSFGTSGTIFRTEDGGETWKQRYSQARSDGKEATSGLSVICSRHVTPDPHVPGRVFLGFMDVGLFRSDDGGRTVVRLMKGVPHEYGNCNFSLAADPDKKDVFYGTFGQWSPARNVFMKSVDAGLNWSRVGKPDNGWREAGDGDGLQLMVAPDGRKIFAAMARGHGVQFSEDEGETWRFCDESVFPRAKSVQTLTSDGTTVYAGTNAEGKHLPGSVWKTTDLGRTWQSVTPAGLQIGQVLGLAVRGDRVLVATGHGSGPQGIWYSRDAGRTWERSVVCYRGVAAAIADDGTLYALCQVPGWRDTCGDAGAVVVSRDDGHTWSTLTGPGFENQTLVSTLTIDPHDRSRLWIGTGGNGVFTQNRQGAAAPTKVLFFFGNGGEMSCSCEL